MYICYIDESGTPEIPGASQHYVLAGLSIPVWHWRDTEREVGRIKTRFGLAGSELHTGWILRPYGEQHQIANFERLSYDDRRREMEKFRNARLATLPTGEKRKRVAKNYRNTQAYIHLTQKERNLLVLQIAQTISGWGFARLFAECIDKSFFDPKVRPYDNPEEQAFTQVVTRFETYLEDISEPNIQRWQYGMLVHDSNPSLEERMTVLMRNFHTKGTLWTKINHIIETPLFVSSQLTNMVQAADLCAYAFRRYVENGDEELFDLVFGRAYRVRKWFGREVAVGARHFTQNNCKCKICVAHRK